MEEKKQGEQKSTEALERQAKNVETFNPYWNNGEFLGPNTTRHEADVDVYGEGSSDASPLLGISPEVIHNNVEKPVDNLLVSDIMCITYVQGRIERRFKRWKCADR